MITILLLSSDVLAICSMNIKVKINPPTLEFHIQESNYKVRATFMVNINCHN